MYEFEHDANESILVARLTPGGNEQEDFGLQLEQIQVALRAASTRQCRLSMLVLFERGHEVPNSRWRQRIADMQKQSSFSADLVLVTDNRLMRGVLTALDWLRGSEVKIHTATSAEQAIALLEKIRGRSCPPLRSMVQRMQVS